MNASRWETNGVNNQSGEYSVSLPSSPSRRREIEQMTRIVREIRSLSEKHVAAASF